jgi:hypothetical protein
MADPTAMVMKLTSFCQNNAVVRGPLYRDARNETRSKRDCIGVLVVAESYCHCDDYLAAAAAAASSCVMDC